MPLRIMFVFGTRPEVIKLAPVIMEARKRPDIFETCVVSTAQHRSMLDQALEVFGLEPDKDLDIMRHDQNLVQISCAVLEGVSVELRRFCPDVVVVQGDTTTTFFAALAAFYERTAVAHVEAGLRSYDRSQPFPEEANRCLVTQIADWHFAPTKSAQQNLLKEGVVPEKIRVTGNTSIDALYHVKERLCGALPTPEIGTQTILLTAHRRENHGEPLSSIFRAVYRLLEAFPKLQVLCPVHPNPRVQELVAELQPHPRLKLLSPMAYQDFVQAMLQADLILSDSGGVQEEAPALGRPVLVLRNATERHEAIDVGVAELVGTNEQKIFSRVSHLLSSPDAYRKMVSAHSPYGDGKAAGRILETLREGLTRGNHRNNS